MAEEDRPIAVVIETTDGTPFTLNMTRGEAYSLGVKMVVESGVTDRDEDIPLKHQTPMMEIDEPEMAFAATHSDALVFIIKPTKLRPIHVTVSRDTAKQIHEALGKALADTQGRPTIRTQ
jgi:hypothetical protein